MLRTSSRETGSVLILAVFVIIVFLLSLGALVTTTTFAGRSIRFDLDHADALSRAEGVAELARSKLQQNIADFKTPEETGTVVLGGRNHTYEIARIGEPQSRTESDGVTSIVQRYEVRSEVVTAQAVARVRTTIDVARVPIFQYAIFYDDDLEILPGPSMTLKGRVHTNGDLYLGSGNTLTIDTEHVRATGSVYRRRKNDGSEGTGTVEIKVAGSTDFATMSNDNDAESSSWADDALATWNGSVQDGAHGVAELDVPEVGSIKAFLPDGTKGHYHEHAGLVIRDGQAFDGDGNPVDLGGALTVKDVYDAREQKMVTVSEIDVGALNASGHFPANGLIYAYRDGNDSSNPDGIRLVNGSEIASDLMVVSEDPVWVQGDFNTTDKKAVAVIADALNLLSNSWSDGGGTMQPASETSYNLAFIAGNVPTPDGGGPYSGGFENLPRFHENWDGVRAIIRGSFANLFQSEIATAPWGTSGVYTPPIRDWGFDPDLLDRVPPFTPWAVNIEIVHWDDGLALPFVN